jgi:ribosomal protein S18 acetylase RimI-like enzyme
MNRLAIATFVCRLAVGVGLLAAAATAVAGDTIRIMVAGIEKQTYRPRWDTPAGSPLCCGLGVLVERNLGLFDIATRTDHQRQGLAQQLCHGILSWGRRRGARTAFLQVVATNSPAVRLYEMLGFQVA